MARVVRVAVPNPLRRWFEYLPPAGDPGTSRLRPGMRVKVPFGGSVRIGVVLETGAEPEIDPGKLRRVAECLDEEPSIPPPLLRLLTWAASYYHHPIGEVFRTALPAGLRRARREGPAARAWRLTESAATSGSLPRAPRQAALVAALENAAREGGEPWLDEARLASIPNWRPAMRALARKGWVEPLVVAPAQAAGGAAQLAAPNESQAQAIEAIASAAGTFQAFLLDGVTGSGKTEVYLTAIDRLVRDEGGQALVLVPEIGLTPQLVARFREALPFPVSVMHSGMAAGERLRSWEAARTGASRVVIGTRSAMFAPLARPALIVVDEEHDSSYKQQEGFRYSARDLALMRGSIERVPVVLGSATPSLESIHLVAAGRCRRLRLAERARGARMPRILLHDVRGQPLAAGLSERLLEAIDERLQRREQALLFVNRRGFAPVVLCHDCGEAIECRDCDSRLVLHRADRRLRCHHCGAERGIPVGCAACGSSELVSVGSGTQRLAEGLAERFPSARLLRVDRDSTRRRGSLDRIVRAAREGSADILVGTQMLAKGHDFPRVTLVGIVDADAGLLSPDFRAPERVAQLVTQVAGRAGRGTLAGEVIVQTRRPRHPLLIALASDGYPAFAAEALAEREEVRLPPFARLVLLRAEAPARATSAGFLATAREIAVELPRPGVEVMGPVPSPMERQGGRYRAQLLLRSASRSQLHAFLRPWVERIAAVRTPAGLRWSLDVDPIELG
ncbi:MAG: primosomal protein N' [Immundisolibacterales bacterium]|nr:primosomal protein N' [Immundisolibacterales bacterium]